jgi:hypothetical protein
MTKMIMSKTRSLMLDSPWPAPGPGVVLGSELPVAVGSEMVGVAPVEGVLDEELDELVEDEDEEVVVGVTVVPAGRVEVVLVVGVGVGDVRPPQVHTPSSPSGMLGP